MANQEEQQLDWIAAHLSGNATEEQGEALAAWLNADPENQKFFQEIQELWDATAEDSIPLPVDTHHAWARVTEKLDRLEGGSGSGTVSLPRRMVPKTYGIAAAILLLLAMGLWFLWPSKTETPPQVVVVNTLDQREEIQLPDGSRVWVNQRSALSYAAEDGARKVELEGEAYFEVVPDPERPFLVLTDGATTRVVGTSFNVRAYPEDEEIRVDVVSGRVEVSLNAAGEKVGLKEKEAARVIEEGQVLEKVEEASPNATAWKEQVLYLEGILLRDAVRDLERFYGAEIRLANDKAGNCDINIGEIRDQALEDVLELITEATILQLEKRDDNSWLIKGPGCN